jgi:predicted extracellular nuclease
VTHKNKYYFKIYIYLLYITLFYNSSSYADERSILTDSQLKVDSKLTVCSQNLENFGEYQIALTRTPNLQRSQYITKLAALVARFSTNSCDVIAVQEVLGADLSSAIKSANILADSLSRRANRNFKVVLGESSDKFIRVGFIYDTAKLKLQAITSYDRVELPRLLPEQKPRFFIRAPLEAQFSVSLGGDKDKKLITLINIHFKSKANSMGDPARLDWETERMEMSEAIRRILISRYSNAITVGDPILIVLGDRNSHSDSASAKILEGRLKLSDFMRTGNCRISKSGVPLCKGEDREKSNDRSKGVKILHSVLNMDPQVKLLEGTYSYKGKLSWIDDILLPNSALKFAQAKNGLLGDYAVGLDSSFPEASDHRLAWLELRW